jgi:hypothetical protein
MGGTMTHDIRDYAEIALSTDNNVNDARSDSLIRRDGGG